MEFDIHGFGVRWVLSKKVLDLLCGWWSRGPNSNIWNITPLYLMHTSGLLFRVLQIVTLFIPSLSPSVCRYFCNCNSLDYFVSISCKN